MEIKRIMSSVIRFNFAIELNRKNLFWNRFSKLIKEASAFRPYLVRPAEYYIEELEELFIEGKKLKSFEDLEIALDKLNYLKFSEFRLGKEKFLKFIEAERNVEEIRRVKFEF